MVRGVRLALEVLLVLVVLGVGDAEAVAGGAKGLVLAMPGTKTAMNLVGGIIEHVYPANGDVAGRSTLDPSLSPDGKKSSVTALESEIGVAQGASRRSVEGFDASIAGKRIADRATTRMRTSGEEAAKLGPIRTSSVVD